VSVRSLLSQLDFRVFLRFGDTIDAPFGSLGALSIEVVAIEVEIGEGFSFKAFFGLLVEESAVAEAVDEDNVNLGPFLFEGDTLRSRASRMPASWLGGLWATTVLSFSDFFAFPGISNSLDFRCPGSTES